MATPPSGPGGDDPPRRGTMDPSALGTVAVELEQMKMRSDYQDNKLEAQDEKLGKIEKLLSSLLE